MTTMEQRILNKLEKLFAEANWGEITITMKSTGLQISLTPCFDDYGETPDPRDIAHCAFILSSGKQDAIWYSGKPEKVANMLAYHDKTHAEWLRQVENLKEYYKNTNNATLNRDCYGIFSDWYKDLYGVRPRGGTPEEW